MPVRHVVTPAANADIVDAYAWYVADRPGRAERFGTALRACIRLVCVSPAIGRSWHGRFRRVNLKRFPYFVLYEFDGTRVIVQAVYHASRDPDELQRRLDEDDAS